MAFLREESVFVANNWQTVQDIVAALNVLDQDLLAVIKSLEFDFRERDWWSDEWQLQLWPETAEACITRQDWPWKKYYAVDPIVKTKKPVGLR